MTDPTLTWSGTDVELVLALGPDSPVSLVSVRPIGRVRVQIGSFGCAALATCRRTRLR